MKIFTKIINEETKEVLLMNQEEAKLLNLEEMEIEFAYNGKAYLLGCAPQQPLEEVKALKKNVLKNNVEDFISSFLLLKLFLSSSVP